MRRLVGRPALPALLLTLIYFLSVRGMYVAGGQFGSSGEVLLNTLALVLGGTPLGLACTSLQARANSMLAIVAIGTALAGTYVLTRGQRSVPLDLLVTLFVVPVASGLLIENLAIFPRYFLPEVVLLYFVAATLCAELWSSTALGRLLAGLLVSVLIFFNLVQGANFLVDGRGGVLAALRTVARASQEIPTQVGVLDSESLSWLVNYYLAHALIEQVKRDDRDPTWLLTASRSPYLAPGSVLQSGPRLYVLNAMFSFGGLSGEQVRLYRRK